MGEGGPAHRVSHLPAEVRPVVAGLAAGAKDALGQGFVGMYLYGSLATGDFDLERSDLDFLVVTDRPLDEASLEPLRALHEQIEAEHPFWATYNKVEGNYAHRGAVRRFDPADSTFGYFCAGDGLSLRPHDRDVVIHLYVVRERRVVVAGPDPRELIDPIGADDLRVAVREGLRDWYRPMLDQPAPPLGAYAVLTLCRMLYTLETGEIATKPGAADWALRTLPGRWHELVRRALAWRRDTPSTVRAAEVRPFLRFVLGRAGT